MAPLAWIAGASLLSWLAVSAIGAPGVNPEALLGMLGPLAAVSATWIAVRRTHRLAPERLTSVMIAGFALEMIFFGAYVAVMVRGLALRPVPFVVSFTVYFIALYAMEAAFMVRLKPDTSRPT